MSEQTKENKEEDKFILLAPYLVEHHWPTISELLAKADDTMMSIADIEDNLLNYDVWVYTRDSKILYALIAEKIGTEYFISRVGGGSKIFPWKMIVESLNKWALFLECTKLTFMGEKYWGNKVGPLGFEIVQYVFSAPVKENQDA